jgi:uncharacterized membrane protein YedE/YeeE
MTLAAWALPLLGGSLIGVSASIAWSGARQIAGISGILGGFLREPAARGFRPGFLFGLLAAGLVLRVSAAPLLQAVSVDPRPLVWLLVSGLLVGFGTQLGSGCTSGHGVCGISRLSRRSLIATLTFMVTAALVVFVTRHVLAGALP